MFASAAARPSSIYSAADFAPADTGLPQNLRLHLSTQHIVESDARACLRGLRYGLAIEVAMLVAGYGLWRLFHIL